MATDRPYNAHFEVSPAGQVAVARACGDGWWEEWVYVADYEWRQLARAVAGRQNLPGTAAFSCRDTGRSKAIAA